MTDPQVKEQLLRAYKGMQKSAPKVWAIVAPRLMKKGEVKEEKVEKSQDDFIKELEKDKNNNV